MEEPQSQLQLHVTDCRDTRIIGKIRDFLFCQVSGINPSVVERRIQELLTSFETPTHPPYALMIQKAVKELNERNGSTEEAISEFIKNEFQDLPWAHSRILGVHLGKLCRAGELLRTASGRYMLMDDYDKFDERTQKGWRVGRRRKKYKRGRNQRGGETLERIEGAERCNELPERENEEQNHLSELHGTGTNEPIEEQGKSDIGQLGVTDVGHGQVVQGQGEAETRQNENTDERMQEAIMELNDKISSSEVMNTEPHMVEKQNPMVIKFRIPCEKQPDNLRGGETLERTEGAERSNGLQGHENEEQNHLSELHGTGANEMIEEQGKSETGQLGVTEECHGRVVQGQGEAEAQQNENTNECEKQIEAITEISTLCSDEISNNESLSASLGSPTVAENQCENQPDNLLAVVENQSLTQQIESTTEISRFCSDEISDNVSASPGGPTMAENQCENQPDNSLAVVENQSLTQQIEATTEISRFCSDGISNNENLSASLGSPIVSAIPKEKLQILEQEQHQNETPSVQQKFLDQTLTSVSFPSLEPYETSYSLPAPNLPAAPNLQQLVDPTSEESLGCITREISLQSELQMSWHRLLYGDLGTTSKMEDSLSSMTGLEDEPQQHGNKGGPKRKLNLDEKTEFGHLQQQLPKRRRRGRPPNPGPTKAYSWSWVPVAPSNNGIHSEKNPNFYNIVKHRKLQSPGSIGRHCELCPQDQAQVQVHSPNLADDNNPSWEQTHRMCPKLKSDADGSCQKPMVLPRSSSQVRGRRELVGLKQSNAYQSDRQLSLETCQSRGKRLLGPNSFTKSR